MKTNACRFLTKRLLVSEWHSLSDEDWIPQDLPNVVCDTLTTNVTRWLPDTWQGEYDIRRAHDWVQERDHDGTTLLIIQRETKRPIGIVILNEYEDNDSGVSVRLGYLLAEQGWGQGFGTELIQGLVAWCRESGIATIVGGVAHDNIASQRVLEKCQFSLAQQSDGESELFYEINLQDNHA